MLEGGIGVMQEEFERSEYRCQVGVFSSPKRRAFPLMFCVGLMDLLSSYCSDALRLNPNSPDILAIRGLVLFLGGKLPQALQHMASALRLDPGHEAARRLRIRVKDVERLKEEGNVAFKSGKYAEAIEKYNEALDVSVSFLYLVWRQRC